jgi:hypothetical protein
LVPETEENHDNAGLLVPEMKANDDDVGLLVPEMKANDGDDDEMIQTLVAMLFLLTRRRLILAKSTSCRIAL